MVGFFLKIQLANVSNSLLMRICFCELLIMRMINQKTDQTAPIVTNVAIRGVDIVLYFLIVRLLLRRVIPTGE